MPEPPPALVACVVTWYHAENRLAYHLPEPLARLRRATKEFFCGPWAHGAFGHGWTEGQLFGWPLNIESRPVVQGLVSLLVEGPSSVILDIDQAAASVLIQGRGIERFDRTAVDWSGHVPWWRHPLLTEQREGLSEGPLISRA